MAHSDAVGESLTSESRLDRDAREAREELFKRKRAPDRHRRKQGEKTEDVLKRLKARGFKARD